MAAKDDLKEHLDAIVSDVIVADKCYFLLQEVSDKANVLNERNFGTFFSFLQDTLLPQYTLTLARLFESPARYRIRGIPATMDFLEANRANIPVDSRQFMIDELKLTGTDGLSDLDLTSMAAQAIRARLPNAQGTELFDALDAIKTRRDKSVAHNEIVDPGDMPPVTWAKTQELLQLAKTVVTVIGGGYLGISFKMGDEPQGRYTLSSDAYRTTVIPLRRLLRDAGLIGRV